MIIRTDVTTIWTTLGVLLILLGSLIFLSAFEQSEKYLKPFSLTVRHIEVLSSPRIPRLKRSPRIERLEKQTHFHIMDGSSNTKQKVVFDVQQTTVNSYHTIETQQKQSLQTSLLIDVKQYLSSLFYNTSEDKVKQNVCVLQASSVFQSSIFQNGQIEKYGSGRYNYHIRKDKCNPSERRIKLIHFSRKKLLRYQRNSGSNDFETENKNWDIIAVTGDEYCSVKDSRFLFRQYYFSNMEPETRTDIIPGGKLMVPLFMPLGARKEFKLVEASEIIPSYKRQYLFNFMGSLTADTRRDLKATLENSNLSYYSKPEVNKSFVHVIEEWSSGLSGYVSPDVYRTIVLNSQLTLCPGGHNPEAYRIYEASMSGSIPVLVLDEYYIKSSCHKAYQPFISSAAPFIYLESYQQLPALIKRVELNENGWVDRQSVELVVWMNNFMTNFSHLFESVMESRFRLRL